MAIDMLYIQMRVDSSRPDCQRPLLSWRRKAIQLIMTHYDMDDQEKKLAIMLYQRRWHIQDIAEELGYDVNEVEELIDRIYDYTEAN